jgi:predicted PurR-regulated permease PerM
MKVKIEIDTNTFVRFWLVVIAFGIGGLAIYSAREALILIVISVFFALALNTPVQYLAKYLPGKSRLSATAAAFLAIVVVLGLFVFLVVPPIVQQTVRLVDTIPALIDENRGKVAIANDLIDKYHLHDQVDKAIESAKNSATGWAAAIGSNVISGIGSVVSFVVSLVLVLVTSFLMLLEGPTWLRRLWKTYENDERRKHHQQLASKMYDVMVGYVNGQLAVAAVAGAGAGVFVFALSLFIPALPGNLALPTMAIGFVLSLVPMFGATIAGVLITLMLLLNSVTAAIIFLVYFIIYQQIENNFISPTIQSRTVQLSALVVIIAVSIGTYVFGLAGGIVSIPIAGWIKVLVEDYFQQRKKGHVKVKVKPLRSIMDAAKKTTKHN